MSYDSAPPPPPPGYGAQPPAYGGGVPGKTNTKAIWSLVTGILGIFCCPIIFSVAALVLSNVAKGEIRSRGEGGQGLATAGMVLGIVGLVLGVIQIALYATGTIDYGFSSN